MKKKLKSCIVSCALGLSVLTTFLFATDHADAASKIEAGFYFNSKTDVGEFYNISEWTKLDGNSKVTLLQKYPLDQITIYLDALDSWAKLSTLSNEGKNFSEGSVDYKDGDIVGSYKDVANPSKIIDFTTEKDFFVIGIE